jgi:hypothetical protein
MGRGQGGAGGHSHYEAILLRIAWRVCYEDHLNVIAERATATPAVACLNSAQLAGAELGRR